MKAASLWLREAIQADIRKHAPKPTLRLPIARAVVCIGCETVREISDRCPCGSAVQVPLERMIGRVPVEMA